MTQSRYFDYTLPFYAGWQLKHILRGNGILFMSNTSLTKVHLKLRLTEDEHLFVKNVIQELTTERRLFKIPSSEVNYFLKEIEEWSLSYRDIKKISRDRVVIDVYGERSHLNLFERYQTNSKIYDKKKVSEDLTS